MRIPIRPSGRPASRLPRPRSPGSVPLRPARRLARLLLLFLAVPGLAVSACSEREALVEPETPTGPQAPPPAFEIRDGAHAGNPHFFFLPPLVPAPSPTGVFDPALSPVVEVCELAGSACGATIATFTTLGGPGSETVRMVPEDEHYIVNWHTKESNLDPSVHYRVRVLVDGSELGHADVDVVSSGKELRNVDTGHFVPLKEGGTLPIKFRIEEGAVAGSLLFSSDRGRQGFDIFLVNPDGTGLQRLGDGRTPAWSPDRSRIAFHDAATGDDEIYVMNADGTGVTRLTTHPALDRDPTWSADGTRIAFQSQRAGGQDIFVMNADGTGQSRLTTLGTAIQPSWSPDGSRIAFAARVLGRFQVLTIRPDGTDQTQVTFDPVGAWLPAWSPDGSKIAFASFRDGDQEIYVMNADGSGQTRLTANPAVDGNPSWSPDGSRIAFNSTRDGNFEIYVMNADGTGQTNITNHPFIDITPAWSR